MLLLLIFLMQPVIAADSSSWTENDEGKVGLISAVTSVGNYNVLQLGLEFDLEPGWKIYWRSPGDAGYPPNIDWQGSKNLAEAIIQWPVPKRFSISGIETIGYENHVVLPLTIRLITPRKPLFLLAHIDYLVCNQICIPQKAMLTLNLPSGLPLPSENGQLISNFLAQVPSESKKHGIELLSASSINPKQVRVVISSPTPFHSPDMFIERDGNIQFGRPEIKLENWSHRATITSPVTSNPDGESLLDKPVTLTIADDNRAVEIVSDISPARQHLRIGGIISMLLIALTGGFILNFMPCVLPVLSLKIFFILRSYPATSYQYRKEAESGSAKRIVQTSFLASAAGIIASFMLLAAITMLLKAAGLAVGWGIQFQQPSFLLIMVTILLIFSANLFGLFGFRIPSWMGSHGHHQQDGNGVMEHFLAGVFATLLATPCSAPFVGTAIGFALANGIIEIPVIFFFLGLGMSLPYLIFAFWPELAAFIPAPGRWMIWLRRLLGLMLLGTAVWLAVILYNIINEPVSRKSGVEITENFWSPFDRNAIAGHVAHGETVFVDVTADWCLTCKVNERAVITRGESFKQLSAPNIVRMQANWTRHNEKISEYLAEFKRYAIPFNAVYGPRTPDGIILPELLTEGAVLSALEKAGKNSKP